MEAAPENLNRTAPRLTSNIKSIVKTVVLAFVIGLLVNLLIAFLLDAGPTFGLLRRVNWTFLAVPFACYFLTYIVDSVRLQLVLSQLGSKVSFANRFQNGVLGGFFSNLTPMASGGQPFQIYHLSSVGVESKKATNIILSRFVEHMVTSLVILAIAFRFAIDLARSVGAGAIVIILGFAVSFFFGVVFVGILIRPDLVGRVALKLEESRLGRFVARIIHRPKWGHELISWSLRLKEDVNFLWKEKVHIMVLDILLGLVNLLLQVYSLVYVIQGMTGVDVNFTNYFATFVMVNLVAYYIPTPGGSGSVEGIYSLVFAGLTRQPELTFVSVVVWRFATYYLHVFFGMFMFILDMRRVNSANRKK